MPEVVPTQRNILVAFIFNPVKLVLNGIGLNLLPTNVKQWTKKSAGDQSF